MIEIELCDQTTAAYLQFVAAVTVEVEREVWLLYEAGCTAGMIETVLRHGGN